MSNYAKFMKDILSKKNKFKKYEMISLTEECSVVLQKKLPQKLKDPRSFTLPCTIGSLSVARVLCGLGASINLMPLPIFRKLDVGEVQSTTISLQLADRSLTYPRGIVQDVLVKVDKFIFLADFMVPDIEEDFEIPIILGHPVLATRRALIDVQKGELTLRVNDKKVAFNIYRSLKHHDEVTSYNMIDMIDRIVEEHANVLLVREYLGHNILDFGRDDVDTWLDDIALYVKWLVGYSYYYFLDGYSGYNQIAIAPED
ncbi:uncharacterized protein LOC120084970 [Benincasa hispida]|uniref:uncharacterized protein LOC120084970 n=1 Tax=Benincasa hispida TaxID=102211 RepID=UPI0019001245|nr:uncharacterized protein LOC120084970 [Benincasa hispida]